MLRYFLLAIAGGLASAVFNLSISVGGLSGLVLTNLNALPLFVVGLGLGGPAVAVAAVVAALAAALFGGLDLGVSHAIGSGLPAIVLCQRALLQRTGAQGGTEWYPLGQLALWAVGLGLIYFAFISLYLSAELAALSERFEEMKVAAGMADASERKVIIERFAAAIPAVLPASWLMSIVLDGALAQTILQRFGRQIRPTADIATYVLPGVAAVILLGGIILMLGGLVADFLPLTLGRIGAAIVGLMVFCYFLQGLAVIHALSRAWPMRGLFLAGTYLVIVFTSGWLIPVAALVGLLEHLIPFRGRAASTSKPDQEED